MIQKYLKIQKDLEALEVSKLKIRSILHKYFNRKLKRFIPNMKIDKITNVRLRNYQIIKEKFIFPEIKGIIIIRKWYRPIEIPNHLKIHSKQNNSPQYETNPHLDILIRELKATDVKNNGIY